MIMKLAITMLFGAFLVLAACTGCGGQAVEGVPCADLTVDAYPCPFSPVLTCDECTKAGDVCGIWGVCAAKPSGAVVAHPEFICANPCEHAANNDACAPGRHCQAVEAGKALAVCYPGEGVKQ